VTAIHQGAALPRSATPASASWNRGVLRAFNERALLDELRQAGPTSRAELARRTGLSKPTVSTALAQLEQAGLVRPTGELTTGRGRAAVLYEPDPSAGHVVAIDVGRRWIRVGVADLSGTLLRRQAARNTARTASGMVRAAADQAHAVVAAAGLDWTRVACAVVGSPGVIDATTGQVRYAVNLPGWGRRGLLERMRAELDTEFVEVANDANLCALGEHAAGVARGCDDFVYLLIGTGLGAGIVAGGQLFRGAHGAAGEIGFLPVSPDTPTDPAAPDAARGGRGDGDPWAGEQHRRGLLEDAVSARAVVRTAVELGMPARPTPSAQRVFASARAGDPLAVEAVRREGARLAHAVAALAAVVDPELVVLGGGLGSDAAELLDPLAAALRELTPLRPRLAVSTLGTDAVLRGAVAVGVEAARDLVFTRRRANAGTM
jgi:predicted NBD/HSP70 family sugar kinase